MHKKIIYSFFLLCFYQNIAYALFCPSNFNLINEGESIESVTQKCGKPASEKKTEVDKPVPQEWTYYKTETVATSTSYQSTGTLKTSISFSKDNKAINISVNGIGVGESTICGTPVRLGSTREQVEKSCGKPSMINKQTDDSGKTEKDTVIEYNYKSDPPVTLVFKNGILTGTK